MSCRLTLCTCRTRAQFAAQVAGFSFEQAADDMEYKTLLVPPLGDKEPAPYFTLFDEERNAFFVCARDVVAGGRTRGVYVLNKGGFANLRTEKDYYNALKKSFPAPFSEVSVQHTLHHCFFQTLQGAAAVAMYQCHNCFNELDRCARATAADNSTATWGPEGHSLWYGLLVLS